MPFSAVPKVQWSIAPGISVGPSTLGAGAGAGLFATQAFAAEIQKTIGTPKSSKPTRIASFTKTEKTERVALATANRVTEPHAFRLKGIKAQKAPRGTVFVVRSGPASRINVSILPSRINCQFKQSESTVFAELIRDVAGSRETPVELFVDVAAYGVGYCHGDCGENPPHAPRGYRFPPTIPNLREWYAKKHPKAEIPEPEVLDAYLFDFFDTICGPLPHAAGEFGGKVVLSEHTSGSATQLRAVASTLSEVPGSDGGSEDASGDASEAGSDSSSASTTSADSSSSASASDADSTPAVTPGPARALLKTPKTPKVTKATKKTTATKATVAATKATKVTKVKRVIPATPQSLPDLELDGPILPPWLRVNGVVVSQPKPWPPLRIGGAAKRGPKDLQDWRVASPRTLVAVSLQRIPSSATIRGGRALMAVDTDIEVWCAYDVVITLFDKAIVLVAAKAKWAGGASGSLQTNPRPLTSKLFPSIAEYFETGSIQGIPSYRVVNVLNVGVFCFFCANEDAQIYFREAEEQTVADPRV
jgi:hypothetical protein